MNEELLQEIKGTLPYLLAAAIAVGGFYGWKGYRQNQRNAANESLANSYTVEEMEESVSRFGSADIGGVMKLRLAKKYFDAGRHQEALDIYNALAANPPEGFGDIPQVGRAQCLEALGKFDEAAKAFDDFAKANGKSYLLLTAKLGAARSLAGKGDQKAALDRIAAVRTDAKDDEYAKARIDATEDCIKRMVK